MTVIRILRLPAISQQIAVHGGQLGQLRQGLALEHHSKCPTEAVIRRRVIAQLLACATLHSERRGFVEMVSCRDCRRRCIERRERGVHDSLL